jgi:heme/copper-type cytochrome/quinol oxidase subunit 3
VATTLTMRGNEPDERGLVTIHPAQESAETTSVVGMVIFLGGWTVMFAAFFFSFAYSRAHAVEWPAPGMPALSMVIPIINTVLILLSSVTMAVTALSFRRGQGQRAMRWLIATVIFGTVFFALQVSIWNGLWADGYRLDSGKFVAYFYLLTAFHAVHVLVGIGLLIWLARKMRRPAEAVRQPIRVRLVSLFWHFVDGAWVCTFLLVYVI